MKKRDFGDYLGDIFESCGDVIEFTDGLDFKKFSKDRKTVNAVIRSLEVLGEASKKIPHDFKNKYPQIPWKQMAGMRDKLIHEYFGVDKEMVWQVAEKHIPQISLLLRKILKTHKF